MKLLRTLTVIVLFGSLAFGSSTYAMSPSEANCIESGGSWARTNGTVSCTYVEEGKNPKFTETVEDTGQGNDSNKEQTNTDCDPNEKCPPGQFK